MVLEKFSCQIFVNSTDISIHIFRFNSASTEETINIFLFLRKMGMENKKGMHCSLVLAGKQKVEFKCVKKCGNSLAMKIKKKKK